MLIDGAEMAFPHVQIDRVRAACTGDRGAGQITLLDEEDPISIVVLAQEAVRVAAWGI